MAHYLTIDQGNSAAKLAVWHDTVMLETRIVPHLSIVAVASFVSTYGAIEAALYCSVTSRSAELVAGLANFIPKVMRLTSDMPLPLKIEYGTPGSLGADRIAAAVGAMVTVPGKPLLVVDAGTAVTYDAVTADGRFVGGNIAPGMNMRLEALHRFTARLPRVEVPRTLPSGDFLGHDTASAMVLGAVYGIVGALEYYKRHLPADTVAVLTGGWAPELSRLCSFPPVVEPHLVSKGLNRILLYNENQQ